MHSNYKDTFLKSIPSGIILGLACAVYLAVENHVVGSFLFVTGLFTIYSLDFYLYTGKVGFLLEHRSPLKILIIWLGNLVGTFFTALLVANTRLVKNEHTMEYLHKYVETKTTDNLLSIFILGAFCGIMMYIAAKCYILTKDTNNSIGGYFGLVLCVMFFLLGGFEHSIANMFYFNLAASYNIQTLVALIVVTLGNAVGGIMFPFIVKFTKKEH